MKIQKKEPQEKIGVGQSWLNYTCFECQIDLGQAEDHANSEKHSYIKHLIFSVTLLCFDFDIPRKVDNTKYK